MHRAAPWRSDVSLKNSTVSPAGINSDRGKEYWQHFLLWSSEAQRMALLTNLRVPVLYRLVRLVAIACYLAIPLLTLLAYRGWAKRVRKDLPRWRSSAGVISIVITFLNWLASVILVLSPHMHFNISFFFLNWAGPIVFIIGVGTSLGFAWKGAPRLQAVL